MLVIGILCITNEFRHGTITPTLLVSPNRIRLVLAKLVASLLVGFVLGLLALRDHRRRGRRRRRRRPTTRWR